MRVNRQQGKVQQKVLENRIKTTKQWQTIIAMPVEKYAKLKSFKFKAESRRANSLPLRTYPSVSFCILLYPSVLFRHSNRGELNIYFPSPRSSAYFACSGCVNSAGEQLPEINYQAATIFWQKVLHALPLCSFHFGPAHIVLFHGF